MHKYTVLATRPVCKATTARFAAAYRVQSTGCRTNAGDSKANTAWVRWAQFMQVIVPPNKSQVLNERLVTTSVHTERTNHLPERGRRPLAHTMGGQGAKVFLKPGREGDWSD